MRVRVIGRLEIRTDAGVRLDLGTPKQRAALALLLTRTGQLVTVEQLIDELWPDNPPTSALANTRTYTANLRRLLHAAVPWLQLESRGVGYVLHVDPDRVDALVFRNLLSRGRAEFGRGDLRAAADSFDRALALWRGRLFEDVPMGPVLAARQKLLDEEHIGAVEDRAEVMLGLGLQRAAIQAMREHVHDHPTRERGWELLMSALHRAGDVSGALAAYTAARAALVNELGVEPGNRLRDLHKAVLQGAPSPASSKSAAPVQVPEQLPMDVRGFVGRSADLAQLDAILAASGRETTAVVISAIAGTAGVGKTALAVHWAHRIRDRFPDGQLYVDLRGYDPEKPVAPTDALASFLRALGVADADTPIELSDRAARYRTAVARRRMLIVLDNASAVDQIRPLLPGSPSCLVVVTSRDSLSAMVARYGAHRLDLDLLPLDDAVALLRALIGARVEAEPDAATTLAVQCARLPLALRVAAELAGARPESTLCHLASELVDFQRRLEAFDAGGDPRTAVRAVFSWSYEHLPRDAARAFRLLGLHPGGHFDAYAAAALVGSVAVAHVQQQMDVLSRAHLLRTTDTGRYAMHDLLRAYAVDLVAEYEGAEGRQESLSRLCEHYLSTAAAAMDTLFPGERDRRPHVHPTDAVVAPVAGAPAAQAWLDAERPNLLAVCGYAVDNGWPGHAVKLAAVLFRYLDVGGHFSDGLVIHTYARRAAHLDGDRGAEGHAMTSLGAVHYRQGRNEQATECYRQALALFREANDRFGEARALTNLGYIHAHLGRNVDAADHHQQALTLFRETGDRTGEAIALTNLGLVSSRQGRYEQAAACHQQALDLYRRVGHPAAEGHALANLGIIHLRDGATSLALDHFQQALVLHRKAGYPTAEAHTLTCIGNAYLKQGRHSDAIHHHEQALLIYRKVHHHDGEAEVLNNLGETHLAAGEAEKARTDHVTALALAVETGNLCEQARAEAGTALAYRASGHAGQAGRHRDRALELCNALGVAEATDIRGHLAVLDEPRIASQ